jgi:hypothetical protein
MQRGPAAIQPIRYALRADTDMSKTAADCLVECLLDWVRA